MQSFAFVIFGSMLFMNSAFAADSLISSHTTHPVLEAGTSASPQASFQIAKTYYLPDYQQQINNVKGDSFTDRGNEDNTNRNDTCSSGGYYSSPLGSGYNCSRVVYAHQACYSCAAKPCPSGYTAGLTKCADKTGYSASYSSNGISGTQTCGKCDYKELPCASGYSTNYQSVNNCGTSKDKGWSWEKSSQYAGNSVCGKCGKLSCNSPYASGITSCSPSDGYALKQDSGRYNGDTVCGYCQPNNCSGTKQSDCNTSNGYTFTRTCKSGTTIYGTCKANTCSGTKQSDCNTANGYTFTANGCISAGVKYGTCKANTCSGVTSVAQCGSSGASGWTWTANECKSAGTSYGTCSAKACASGYTAGLTSCSTNYTISYNGYSGNSKCGKCTYSCSVNDSGRFYNEAACGIFAGYDLFPLPFIESCGYKLYLCKQWNYPQGGDFNQSVCNEACGNLRYSSGSGFPAEQKDHDENLCRAMCNYIFRCDSYIGWCPPDVQNQSPPMML